METERQGGLYGDTRMACLFLSYQGKYMWEGKDVFMVGSRHVSVFFFSREEEEQYVLCR